MKPGHDRDILKVVAKTFQVIEVLAVASDGAGVTMLARKIKQPKATVFRILSTLSQLGYAEKDDVSNSYRLTSKVRLLVHGEKRETLCRASRPFMERLLSQFEQAVNLAMLDHNQVVYVDMLEGLRSIRMSATVNTYAPVHCTAIGKSIIAFLPSEVSDRILKSRPMLRLTANTIQTIPALQKHLGRIRTQGFAVDDEETEAGARCVGAPIYDPTGIPFAALSVSGPTSHIHGKKLLIMARAVKESANKISAKLGFRAH
jgi:IclR family KDG regulon transcriptional repressor